MLTIYDTKRGGVVADNIKRQTRISIKRGSFFPNAAIRRDARQGAFREKSSRE